MRRFNYVRSTLFTHHTNDCITAKRTFLTKKDVNAVACFFLMSGLATAAGAAGLIFGAYKAVRYIDNALDNIPRVDEDQLEPRGPIFGPKNEPIRPV